MQPDHLLSILIHNTLHTDRNPYPSSLYKNDVRYMQKNQPTKKTGEFSNHKIMSMEEVRRWEGLGMDCLVQVFSKLNLEDRTLGVPFVCKSWHQASLNPLCWRVLNFRELDLMPWGNFGARFAKEYRRKSFSFSEFMRLVVSRSQGLALELAFPAALGPSLPDLVYASRQCPRVRALVLPNLLQRDEKQIPEMLARWKDLEMLQMGLKPLALAEMLKQIGISCKRFVGLQMYGCFSKADAMAIVEHLPKLKHLAMSASFLSREDLISILHGCKQLETLKVVKCRGFNVDDVILNKASSIKVFEHKDSKLQDGPLAYDYGDNSNVPWAMSLIKNCGRDGYQMMELLETWNKNFLMV